MCIEYRNRLDIEGENDEIIRFLNDIIGEPEINAAFIDNSYSDDKTIQLLNELRSKQPVCVTTRKIMPMSDKELLWNRWFDNDFDIDLADVEFALKTLKENRSLNKIDPIYWNSENNVPITFLNYASKKYKLKFIFTYDSWEQEIYVQHKIENGENIITFDEDTELVFNYLMGDDWESELLCHCENLMFSFSGSDQVADGIFEKLYDNAKKEDLEEITTQFIVSLLYYSSYSSDASLVMSISVIIDILEKRGYLNAKLLQ